MLRYAQCQKAIVPLRVTRCNSVLSFKTRHIIQLLHSKDCNYIKETLNNSSVNYQSTGNIQCDFLFPLIFNRLTRFKMAAHPCAAETLN